MQTMDIEDEDDMEHIPKSQSTDLAPKKDSRRSSYLIVGLVDASCLYVDSIDKFALSRNLFLTTK